MLAEINPLAIALPVLAVLALVVVLAALSRRDNQDAVGRLARETRTRDAGLPPVLDDHGKRPGREVERLADLERRGGLEPADERELAPVPYVPPDPETLGVTRRQFLNRSIVAFFGLGLTGFGLAVIGFLWPQPKGGFGSKINAGSISDIQAKIAAGNGFYYVAEGRMWITEFPAGAVDKAKAVYSPAELTGMEAGVVALYQKCPHLGCRVPSCLTSQWFECPCHGSQYNQVGEKKGGPAPRGMDRFAMEVTGGNLIVNTGLVIQGPPVGTNTTGQEAEGPNCV